eukprot:GHVO01050823.1.p1 GENE.GHVO01050823.1~~GHVO01050823.1.p1  ORF type:complete len:536 (-),score=112.70 GHVO01050823.1:44-1483(-)
MSTLTAVMKRILTSQITISKTMASRKTVKKKSDQEKVSRGNVEHAILFEALNVIIHYGKLFDISLRRSAAELLGGFVAAQEANIRYLGMEATSRLAAEDLLVTQPLKRLVGHLIPQLSESDASLRKQALNLLYVICDKENWQEIVDELLECLKNADADFQEELVVKIAVMVEREAPFTWYVDVVFKMIECAPTCVTDDVWHRVIQVITGFEDTAENVDLQSYAAQKAYDYLSDTYAHEMVVRLGSYILGEFGHRISVEAPGKKQFALISKHFQNVTTQTKSIILLAAAKMYNAHTDIEDAVLMLVEDNTESMDLDLQQRALEISALLQMDEEVVESVLAMMPCFSDDVQRNNPLIRRMKITQQRQRAKTRTQLETLANTPGDRVNISRPLGPSREDAVTDDDEPRRESVRAKVESSESSDDSVSSSSSLETSSEDTEDDESDAPPPRCGHRCADYPIGWEERFEDDVEESMRVGIWYAV